MYVFFAISSFTGNIRDGSLRYTLDFVGIVDSNIIDTSVSSLTSAVDYHYHEKFTVFKGITYTHCVWQEIPSRNVCISLVGQCLVMCELDLLYIHSLSMSA